MDEKFSLILDANVVIDYCHADENILALSARHLGNVFIPRPILNDEVKELDQKDCERIRLIISDPELDEIIAAGSKRGRLSFYDRLLLIMAKNRNWKCERPFIPIAFQARVVQGPLCGPGFLRPSQRQALWPPLSFPCQAA